MDLSSLSITELKQMLARVNHDLKLNKPTIKRIKKAAIISESEGIICNRIAAVYTGNKQVNPSDNNRIKADIAIQKDILSFIDNGGMIKARVPRKQIKPLSTVFGTFTKRVSL